MRSTNISRECDVDNGGVIPMDGIAGNDCVSFRRIVILNGVKDLSVGD